MNRDEAEKILWRYRPGFPEAAEPEVTEALALAGSDPALARWLAEHISRQQQARQSFRAITAPPGLREQIVSEHQGRKKVIFLRRQTLLLAAAVVVAAMLIGLPFWLHSHRPPDADLAVYQRQMAALALRGYGMDVITNDPVQIRGFLAQNHAPADYVLPAALQKAALAGCAIENWRGAKISMLCFTTGRPLPNGASSDLWLFVIAEAAVPGAPAGPAPQLVQFNRLTAATWHQGGKLYLLATTADEAALRNFL